MAPAKPVHVARRDQHAAGSVATDDLRQRRPRRSRSAACPMPSPRLPEARNLRRAKGRPRSRRTPSTRRGPSSERPGRKRTRCAMPSSATSFSVGPPGVSLETTDSSTSIDGGRIRRAPAATPRRPSAVHRRCYIRDDPARAREARAGRNRSVSTPIGIDDKLARPEAEVAHGVVGTVLRGRDARGICAGDPGLHAAGTRTTAAARASLLPRRHAAMSQPAVDRDRVMDRARPAAGPLAIKDSSPVPKVWLSCTTSNSSRAGGEDRHDPLAERARLREPGSAHDRELLHVDPRVRNSDQRGDPQRVRLAERSRLGTFVSEHPRIQLGVGRPGEDLDACGPGRRERPTAAVRTRPGRRSAACSGKRSAQRAAVCRWAPHLLSRLDVSESATHR